MYKLADRLKQARVEAGHLTAGDAAKEFGWNEHTYRANENGTRAPRRLRSLPMPGDSVSTSSGY